MGRFERMWICKLGALMRRGRESLGVEGIFTNDD